MFPTLACNTITDEINTLLMIVEYTIVKLCVCWADTKFNP